MRRGRNPTAWTCDKLLHRNILAAPAWRTEFAD